MSNGMKKTEIGEIPVEWEVSQLGDLVTLQKGKKVEPSMEWSNNLMPVIGASSFGGKYEIFTHSENGVRCVESDILMLWDGERSGLCSTGHYGILGSTVAKLTPIPGINSKYLFYNLQKEFDWIQRNRTGSGIPHVPSGLPKMLFVALPPLPEQQKIAEILSTVDEKIAVIDDQLAKTTKLKTGLMQLLLTKGIGHTEFKDSSLGKIPKGWDAHQLGDVLELINGKAFQPNEWNLSGLPIIRIQNLNNSKASFNYYNGFIEDKYYVHANDILFAWSGTKGVSFGARIWKGEKAVLNQHIFRVVPNETKIDYSFAYILLKQAQAEIETKAHGFKSSFVHVKKSDITKLRFALPPLKEQRQIAELLTTLEEKIQVLRDKKAYYQTLKRGLMQQLLTGKLRVRLAQDVVAA